MDNISEVADNRTSNAEDYFPSALQIIYFCVALPLGVVILIGNIILMAVIASKKGPLKPSTRTMLCSLVLCDALAGGLLVLNTCLVPFQEDMRKNCETGCLLWGLLLTLPFTTGFIHLFVICLERRHAVNDPANTISIGRSAIYCVAIWAYCLALCAGGMLFLLWKNRALTWKFCDILPLPGFYLLILCVHIFMAVVLEVYAAINVRSTLRLHQRKIQVTNTITYSNLVEDTKVAWIFFSAFIMQLLPVLPFMVLLVVLSAGVHSHGVFVLSRICYIIAQIPGLKFVLFLKRSKELHKAAVKKLGCSKSEPHLSPSHTH